MKWLFKSVAGTLILVLAGCAASTATTPSTPAAPQQSIDQQMAGWLLTAQTAITGTEPLVVTYPGLKDPLNRVIAAYNVAEASYMVYHAAVVSGSPPDSTALSAQIQQVLASATSLASLYK